MFNKKTKEKGFTLIELLVVISIIGLLSTLAIVALNNARMKARDVRRMMDLKQIKLALDLYYDVYKDYPLTWNYGEYTPAPALGCTGGFDCSNADQDGLGDGNFIEPLVSEGFMTQVPYDPINNISHNYKYYYYYDNGGYSYGCKRPFYAIIAYGLETKLFTDDHTCFTQYIGDSNYVIVGGPNY